MNNPADLQNGPPSVLLVSDAPLTQECYGLSRTLRNLFADYPSDRLTQLVPKQHEYSSKFSAIYEFNPETIRKFRRRYLAWIDTLLEWVNCSLLGLWEPTHLPRSDLVLVSGSHLSTLLVGARAARQSRVPCVIYLMDDLLDLRSKSWGGGTGDTLLRELLSESAGWMMISEELARVYEERYKLSRPKSIIIHNPVPHRVCQLVPYANRSALSIAYAGSTWGMHLDALRAFIGAVSLARAEGLDLTFTVYTSASSMDSLVRLECPDGVVYGGELPYATLHERLASHDLLLVAASFEERYRHLSRASVQTKLTDYMAAGRAVFSLGPSESAIHAFVNRWSCGHACYSPSSVDIATQLSLLAGDRSRLEMLGRNGVAAARAEFSDQVVCAKLKLFLQDIALGAGT